jgi:hypothetical protein
VLCGKVLIVGDNLGSSKNYAIFVRLCLRELSGGPRTPLPTAQRCTDGAPDGPERRRKGDEAETKI